MTPNETTTVLRKFARACRTGEYLWGTSLPGVPAEVGAAVEAAIEMIDRLEAAEKDYQHALATKEMYQRRLTETEDERDDLLACFNEWIAKTEWVQDELTRDVLPAKYFGMHRADAIKAEIDELRAKIERMEKQEPACWAPRFALNLGGSALSFDACRNNLWGDEGVPLYTIPGERGE